MKTLKDGKSKKETSKKEAAKKEENDLKLQTEAEMVAQVQSA
jgi:hypothetical protein